MLRSPFHLVQVSPWPLTSALGAFLTAVGLVSWFHMDDSRLLCLGLLITSISMCVWWRDVTREATYQGHHTKHVTKGIRLGVILFITSEICFFLAFFWAYFHSGLSPGVDSGSCWPPLGVSMINPYTVPMLNTIVLLASGASVTWAHNTIVRSNSRCAKSALIITVGLGLFFTFLQVAEYGVASFSISDSIYGSAFFVATGFHGAHVMIGSSFLLVCLYRMFSGHFSAKHHAGLEAAAWYWHFVDVVWICLYLCVYWWPFAL